MLVLKKDSTHIVHRCCLHCAIYGACEYACTVCHREACHKCLDFWPEPQTS